ncbi:unnamed protein product [Durusdinium trenchii]|uniref:Uncharacterized protein n=2 Tax=Durusdinium trenchii TaxID=1381693 RepID=A0ABP0PXG4_9DINO
MVESPSEGVVTSERIELESEWDFASFVSQLDDHQIHELVGRALREENVTYWRELFEQSVTKRSVERLIRFVELSGREIELRLRPFDSLGAVHRQLLTMLPEMRTKAIRYFDGTTLLLETTLVAMLPDVVTMVGTEGEAEFLEEPDFTIRSIF